MTARVHAGRGSYIKAFVVGLAGSLAANLLLVTAFRPLIDDPAMPLEILNASAIALFTTGGAIGATIVYAIMRQLMAEPDRPYIIVAIVALVASLIPDYLIIGETTGKFAGANTGSALLLMLLHVVEAAIMVPALIRLWGKRIAPAIRS